jgi:hypothetical protein
MNALLLTPTFDTCEALKEAGFPQDTVFTWLGQGERSQQPRVSPRGTTGGGAAEERAAPTLSELLAHLPAELAFSVPHPIYGSVERTHTLEVHLGSRPAMGYHLVGSHEVQRSVEHEHVVEAAAHLYLALRAEGRLEASSVGASTQAVHSVDDGERLAWAA